jgi:transcriptional regulator with XRE-family HTH domain
MIFLDKKEVKSMYKNKKIRIDNKLGTNIGLLIEATDDLTAIKVAKKIGVSKSAFSNYTRNRREPDYATLIKIADYFDVSVDYLLGRRKYLEKRGEIFL